MGDFDGLSYNFGIFIALYLITSKLWFLLSIVNNITGMLDEETSVLVK